MTQGGGVSGAAEGVGVGVGRASVGKIMWAERWEGARGGHTSSRRVWDGCGVER